MSAAPPAARFKDGTEVDEVLAEMIARAFGFASVREMNTICAAADARRAARKRRTAA